MPPTTVAPKARFVTVTPKMAHEYLSKNRKNRNLRPSKVDRLARDILAGNYLLTGEAIKFDVDGNLIDGQHRCAAILKADKSVQVLVVTGLPSDAQKVLDTGAARTPSDALQLSGRSHAAILASASKMAMNWEAGNIRTSASTLTLSPTHSEVLAFVDGDPHIQWAAARAQHFYGAGLSAPPSAIAFAMWLIGQVDAPQCNRFFESLAEMRTDGSGDPRYVLLRRLHGMKDERTTSVYAAFVLVRGWNAWRKGETIKRITGFGGGSKAVAFPEPV